MDGSKATGFARSRNVLGDDFTRAANHQRLLEAILAKLRQHEDDEGFIEAGALAAVQHLDTNLSPAELYRFAQAVTQVELRRVAACVVPGSPGVVGEQSVVFIDEEQARRWAAEADDGAALAGGCQP